MLLGLIAGPKDDRRVWEIIPNYSPHPPINYPTHPPYPRPPPELPTQPPRQPPQTPREPPRQPPLTPRLPPTRSDPVPPEKPTKKPHGKAGKPDTCDTSYDAISVIRREVFIFKGRVSECLVCLLIVLSCCLRQWVKTSLTFVLILYIFHLLHRLAIGSCLFIK